MIRDQFIEHLFDPWIHERLLRPHFTLPEAIATVTQVESASEHVKAMGERGIPVQAVPIQQKAYRHRQFQSLTYRLSRHAHVFAVAPGDT